MAHILAVDDDPDLCTLLKTALERDGHAVEIRTSGVTVTESLCRWADCILLDSGAGTGKVFDWDLLPYIHRPYFLAGGLDTANVTDALRQAHPYGVDVSSGIESDGRKDREKMAQFVAAVRKEEVL